MKLLEGSLQNLEENMVRLSHGGSPHSPCKNVQINDSKRNFKGNQRQEALKYQEKMEENACNALSVYCVENFPLGPVLERLGFEVHPSIGLISSCRHFSFNAGWPVSVAGRTPRRMTVMFLPEKY